MRVDESEIWRRRMDGCKGIVGSLVSVIRYKYTIRF